MSSNRVGSSWAIWFAGDLGAGDSEFVDLSAESFEVVELDPAELVEVGSVLDSGWINTMLPHLGQL